MKQQQSGEGLDGVGLEGIVVAGATGPQSPHELHAPFAWEIVDTSNPDPYPDRPLGCQAPQPLLLRAFVTNLILSFQERRLVEAGP